MNTLLRFNKIVLLWLLLAVAQSNLYCFNVGSEILRQEPSVRKLSLEQLKEFKDSQEKLKLEEAEKAKTEREIEQKEQEREQAKETLIETKPEVPKDPVVSLKEQTEKHEPEKPEEAPGIRVEQKQDVLSEINKTGVKVKEFARLWNEAWEKHGPNENAAAIFREVKEKAGLDTLGILAFKSFELNQLENPLQKTAELKAQESVLQSYDATLSEISNQLTEKYKTYADRDLKESERKELINAAATIALITNLQSNIIAEEQKVFDAITSVDLWQKSSFKNLFHGTKLSELSFKPADLPKTSELLEEINQKLKNVSEKSNVAKMTNPQALVIDAKELKTAVKAMNEKLEELKEDKRQTKEFIEAKALLAKLLGTARTARDVVSRRNIIVQNQTFASRVTEFGTFLRNTIASFFSIVTGNSPILRAIQTKSGGYGADERPQQRALRELFETGASKERRIQAYRELQKHIAQLEQSMQFASELVRGLEEGNIANLSEEEKQALIQLRSTLREQVGSMQRLGKMIGIEIKNPSDTLGASVIGFAKKFYTPTLLDAADEDMWLLPYIAKEASILGGAIRDLNLQSKEAGDLLRILDSKIFKQSSPGARALYNVSLATEILAEAGGIAAIGTMVGVGVFSTLTGMDLPFQDILDWTPLIFVSGASLMYIISYASYQGAVKLGKVNG